MKDINGIEIKVGDTVKTQQPAGGILPPAPAEIGIVGETICTITNKPTLQIRYKRQGHDFYSYILLEGKINEVINPKTK